MLRAFAVLSIVGSLSFAGALVAPALVEKDYATLPPAPADIEAKMAATKISLGQALEIAAKETGGRALSAELSFGSPPSILVMLYGGGRAQRVIVNAESGQVMSKVEIPRLPGDPVSGEPVETASGLKYYELRPGTGEKPAGPQTQVKVHYSGWLVDGTPFDSSVERGQPYPTALNNVIAGWTEGVGSMQVGGKRKLIVPYKLAYGERGGRGIPPKATLIFDVELIEITKK